MLTVVTVFRAQLKYNLELLVMYPRNMDISLKAFKLSEFAVEHYKFPAMSSKLFVMRLRGICSDFSFVTSKLISRV